MKPLICARVADTPASVADAQRVRHQVFVIEKGLLDRGAAESAREIDAYDDLDTTLHFLAYAGDTPVGAARVLLPNADVARRIAEPLGVDMASRYDLRAFAADKVSVAEVSRMSILPEHRGTEVLCALYLAMYRESARVGLTHWVAAANVETDDLGDAEIAYRVGERAGLLSERWRVEPVGMAGAGGPARRPLYTPEERARAGAGDLAGLRLPRTLRTFAQLAARVMGRPLRERGYTVCSLPIVVDLTDVAGTAAFKRAMGRG